MEPPDYSDWTPEPLPKPWFVAPAELRATLKGELVTEVAAGHPLHGEGVVPVAKCAGCDDALFAVEGGPYTRWARVHLTWSGKEERPPWPQTTIYDALAQFRADVTEAH